MFVRLTKVTTERTYNDLEQVTETETATPTMINFDKVRSFYPRKENRVGTRINYDARGHGVAVRETFDEVLALTQA